MGVAVDSSGNVYVADDINNHIQKFYGTGTFITQWGGYGNGNGKFANPYGVAVDSSGNVYVADIGNDLIQKFRKSGSGTTDVIADFYGSPTAGKAPLEVDFTNLSTGDIASYEWDFGDKSAKSSEENPTHTYSITGQYTVSLMVTGQDGTTDRKVMNSYITVANLADCPIKQTMSDQTLIETLHKLRDERFNGFYGSLLTIVFYKNAPEISCILSRNQALQKTFRQLITDNIGIAEELIATGSATLPEQNAQEIIAFLQDLGKEGSFGLKLYTAFVIKGIEYRFLMRGIGLEVE
jgi:PKD repeat protein